MERPKTENLTAWITGRNLNVFQKADAVIEYNKLLDYVKVIEEQLTIHSVVVPKGTLCNCNSTTTDEFRNGINWRTCNNCGISRIA